MQNFFVLYFTNVSHTNKLYPNEHRVFELSRVHSIIRKDQSLSHFPVCVLCHHRHMRSIRGFKLLPTLAQCVLNIDKSVIKNQFTNMVTMFLNFYHLSRPMTPSGLGLFLKKKIHKIDFSLHSKSNSFRILAHCALYICFCYSHFFQLLKGLPNPTHFQYK